MLKDSLWNGNKVKGHMRTKLEFSFLILNFLKDFVKHGN